MCSVLKPKMVVKTRAARMVSIAPLQHSIRASNIHMASSAKPTVNCVSFPMVGVNGEEAAASQTSRSGLDMSVGGAIGLECYVESREAGLVAFGGLTVMGAVIGEWGGQCGRRNMSRHTVVNTRRRGREKARLHTRKAQHTATWQAQTMMVSERAFFLFLFFLELCKPHLCRQCLWLHRRDKADMPPRSQVRPLRDVLGYPTSPPTSPHPEALPDRSSSSPEISLHKLKANQTSLKAKRKATTDPPNASPKRIKQSPSTPTAADEAPARPAKRIVPFPEKPAVIEEREGVIEFRVVNNDGRRESTIILTGLKCIFQKQLPKMPKDYIARLVYDRTHLSIAIVKHPLEVVGYVCTFFLYTSSSLPPLPHR